MRYWEIVVTREHEGQEWTDRIFVTTDGTALSSIDTVLALKAQLPDVDVTESSIDTRELCFQEV